VFVDPANLTGWEYIILQNRGLVMAGTILILRTQMLPHLHQYSHDCMSQLLLKLLSTASHLALRLSLKKKKKNGWKRHKYIVTLDKSFNSFLL